MLPKVTFNYNYDSQGSLTYCNLFTIKTFTQTPLESMHTTVYQVCATPIKCDSTNGRY